MKNGRLRGSGGLSPQSIRHIHATIRRALNDAGTEWECYIGEEAVKQQIISQGFLGQTQTTPAVG